MNGPRYRTLQQLPTPALVLDRRRLRSNAEAMAARMTGHGVSLRPHLKTAKSPEVARILTEGQAGGITVSTLREAEYFLEHGFRDLLYAVSMLPERVERVAALQRQGARVQLITDDVEVARALGERAAALETRLEVLVEVEMGPGRTGVDPAGPHLLEVAGAVNASPAVSLVGVLTHAGHSYHCDDVAGVREVAEQERTGAVRAALRLREAGMACPTVSAGSTPTAIHAQSLEGLTEMRPGNYAFFDLFQEGLGSCRREEIAVTVLATVISRQRELGRIVVDAGSLALSSDRGANRFGEVGYGRVLDVSGEGLNLIVAGVNQEHGIVECAKGEPPKQEPIPAELLGRLPVGTRVRILPNHSCLTAAMFDRYHVVDDSIEIVDVWDRANRW